MMMIIITIVNIVKLIRQDGDYQFNYNLGPIYAQIRHFRPPQLLSFLKFIIVNIFEIQIVNDF